MMLPELSTYINRWHLKLLLNYFRYISAVRATEKELGNVSLTRFAAPIGS